MKRNIQAFWLEFDRTGFIRAVILRDRRNWEEVPVYAYVPTPSSLKRINRAAKSVSRSAFSPYDCEPIDDSKVTFGWVLNRRDKAVYPPPMGTKNAGQKRSFVPSEA